MTEFIIVAVMLALLDAVLAQIAHCNSEIGQNIVYTQSPSTEQTRAAYMNEQQLQSSKPSLSDAR